MTLISIQNQQDFLRLVCEDGTAMTLRKEYLDGCVFDEGEGAVAITLAPGKEEAVLFADACSRAEAAALKLVARAEQYERGLTVKLMERGHAKKAAEYAVRYLVGAGFIDDRRYTRLWIAARVTRKADAPRKLLALLCAKGIRMSVVKEALSQALADDAGAGLLRRYLDRQDAPASVLRAEGFSAEAIEAVTG